MGNTRQSDAARRFHDDAAHVMLRGSVVREATVLVLPRGRKIGGV